MAWIAGRYPMWPVTASTCKLFAGQKATSVSLESVYSEREKKYFRNTATCNVRHDDRPLKPGAPECLIL